jgi:hypothetical protein
MQTIERRRNGYFVIAGAAITLMVVVMVINLQQAVLTRIGVISAMVGVLVIVYCGLHEEFGDFCRSLQNEISILQPQGFFSQFLVTDLEELAERICREAGVLLDQRWDEARSLTTLERHRKRLTQTTMTIVVSGSTTSSWSSRETKWKTLLDAFAEASEGCRTYPEADQLYFQALHEHELGNWKGPKGSRSLLTKAISLQRTFKKMPFIHQEDSPLSAA